MRKKIILMLLILLLTNVTVYADTNPPDFHISGADAYVLMEINSGKIIAEYNGDKKLYPASTTKVMTAVLALENGDMSQVMTASKAAVYDIGKDGMNIGIQPGEKIKMKDLLNAMLVVSANETANIIAENISGKREKFIDLMNQKAKQLGAENTNFENPCGMHDDNHYTTASDLGLIARYAMQKQQFRKIVKKTYYNMPATNKHSDWNTLYTTNVLLRANDFYGYEITGVKSGYTNPAGRCLISSATNDDGVELMAVVMGIRGGDTSRKLKDISDRLYNYGFNNYKSVNLINKNVFMELRKIINAKDNTPLVSLAQKDLNVFIPKSVDTEKIDFKINYNESIKLPVIEGDVVGTADFYSDDKLLGTVNVIAGNNIYADLSKQEDENNKKNKKQENDDKTGNNNDSDSNLEINKNDNPVQDKPEKDTPVLLKIGKIVLIGIGALVVLYLLLATIYAVKKKIKYGKRKKK